MLRNIHFFNIKPGADERRMLHLIDNELAEYAKTFGCIERKTWKLLNASSPRFSASGLTWESAQSTAYMNESLWPSQKESDAFSRAKPPDEVRKFLNELFSGIEIEKTVRYVDEEG